MAQERVTSAVYHAAQAAPRLAALCRDRAEWLLLIKTLQAEGDARSQDPKIIEPFLLRRRWRSHAYNHRGRADYTSDDEI